jgi:hypothetical protein
VAPGAIAFTPASYNFGSVALSTGKDGHVALQNTGLNDSGPVSFQFSGTGSSDFSIIGENCDVGLVAGASCSVTVHYHALSAGTVNATLTATDAQGGTAAVTITGTGS